MPRDTEEAVQTVVGRHGSFRFPADTYIGQSLTAYGEYSETEARLLCSLVKPGDVVVEAGAHVGTITVPLARAVGPDGAVYAYEPQEHLHSMLHDNISGNGLRHVFAVRSALGAASSVTRYTPNPGNTGAVELGAAGVFETPVETLDAMSLARLDLIKADVEGMEVEVLLGAQHTIERCRPAVYVENDRAEKTRHLLDLLFGWGYRVWRHEPMLFSSDNFFGRPDNLWPGIASLNLVALPEERDVPETVKGLVEIKPGQWAAVCRFGGVGDNLIAAGVIPGLARAGNRVEVITNKLAGEVFRHNPYVSKLSICEDNDQPGGGSLDWQMWFQKRGHEYAGGLFHLSHTVETTLAFVPAQTQFWWPLEVRRQLCNTSYLDLALSICGAPFAPAPLFWPSRGERAKAIETKAKMGEKVIGWILEGSRFDKVYPQSALCVARLIRETGAAVMLSGAPGRRGYELAKDIEKVVVQQNGSTAGLFLAMTVEESDDGPACEWPLRRSLAQLQVCDLVIGPDTGGMWSVAFSPMPKIMLLSHASPTNITKYWVNTTTMNADQKRVPCWPCHRLQDSTETCVSNKDNTGVACISDINAEAIIQAAKRALA